MAIQVSKFDVDKRRRIERHEFEENAVLDIIKCQQEMQKSVALSDEEFNVIVLTEYV